MNDREQVEALFCSRILYLIVIGGTAPNPYLHKIATELIQAPLQNLSKERSSTIRRRVVRLEEKYIHPFVGRAHGSKIALIAYYFINKLLDEDYLDIPDNSPFRELANKLFSAITTSLEFGSRSFIEVSKSANKQAQKMLTGLQADGYFQY